MLARFRSLATARTACLAIDLQEANRGAGSWPVAGYDAVLANARAVLAACRGAGVPVIYTRTALDPRGIDCQRFEPRDSQGRPYATVLGDAETAISPEVAPQPADIVVDKPRFSAFYSSYLAAVLGRFDIEHLIVFGTWSEACLTTSIYDALWRDYRVTLVFDACGAATETIHQTAMCNLANWLYGGLAVRSGQLAEALAGRPYTAWQFQQPAALAYDRDTLAACYAALG